MVLKQNKTKQLSWGVLVSSNDTYVGSSRSYQEASDTEKQYKKAVTKKQKKPHMSFFKIKFVSLPEYSFTQKCLAFALIWHAWVKEQLSLPSAVCSSSFSF